MPALARLWQGAHHAALLRGAAVLTSVHHAEVLAHRVHLTIAAAFVTLAVIP